MMGPRTSLLLVALGVVLVTVRLVERLVRV
jgi:hypothetical protein